VEHAHRFSAAVAAAVSGVALAAEMGRGMRTVFVAPASCRQVCGALRHRKTAGGTPALQSLFTNTIGVVPTMVADEG
jgi:hypothetical protein